jgi:RHS repeat-associated protein
MRRFALLALVVALAPAAFGQQHPSFERGFDPVKAYQVSEVDSINLMNGNLALEIAIGPSYLVTPTFSYGLKLTYNSKAWDHEEVGMPVGDDTVIRAMPNRISNAGMGWSLSLGMLLSTSHAANDFNNWLYIDPSGGSHAFYPDLHGTNSGTCGTSTCYTRDSSYLRLRHLSASQKVIEFPSGERHLFEPGDVVGEWRVKAMGDRFGPPGSEAESIDDVTVTYPIDLPVRWSIKDRHGRIQEVVFESVSQGTYTRRIKEVRLTAAPDSAGSARTAIWPFTYSISTFKSACSNTDVSTSTVTTSMLALVGQPDASQWVFTYHLADSGGGSCHSRGVIAGVTYPTGGRLEYAWHGVVLPPGGCSQRQWQAHSAGVAARNEFNFGFNPVGTFTYTSSLSTPPVATENRNCASGRQYTPPAEELTVTVTTPLKDQEKHYFSVFPGADFNNFTTTYDQRDLGLPFTRHQPTQGGRYLSSVIYDCADDGTACVAKRETYVSFDRDPATDCPMVEAPNCSNSNRRLFGERTRYLDDIENPNTNPVTYRYADVARLDFDGLGHYRTETTGGNFGQADVATTITKWNPTRGTFPGSFVLPGVSEPWVLGTFNERRTTEGTSTVVQQACFDTKGFLLRMRTLAGTTAQSKDLLTVWTPDVQGQATSERRYGGDVDPIGTSELCALPLPAQPSYRTDYTYSGGVVQTAEAFSRTGVSVGFKSTDQTVDPASGLVVSERDPAGVTTTYRYDLLGRLETIEPEAGAEGKTRMTYTKTVGSAGPQLQVEHRNSADSAAMTREIYLFDGLGRLIEEQRTMPGSTAKRFTTYDAGGNVKTRSEWGPDATAAKSEFKFYDPFGRPWRKILPDGSKEVYFYGGVRGRSWQVFVGNTRNASTGAITEATINVGEVYDRQGRLWKANEPKVGATVGDQTVYDYDAAGRLVSVSQGTQTRLFSYDGRGVMTAEQHPELGATGNGAVAYSRFDALGNPGRRVEAGITFDTTFDALGRPAKLEELRPDSTRRPWREWSYGLGQTSANRSAAKVVTATRHNWIVPPWGSTEVDLIVTQTSTYGGRSGRISAQSTTINSGGQSYAQTFTWNELGLLQSETYPVCGHATCTGSAGTTAPRTVSYVYTWGQLTNVSGWATIGYHPNGLVSRVSHGNGVVDTITNDLDEMARPLRIETTGASSNFKSGDYQYDSAGNIVKIGTDWYLYDARSRLVSSRVDDQPDLPGVDRLQSYTFDRYGNLGSTTTQIGAGAPITRTSPVVTTTNRLSGAAYDAFGNVTSFSGQSYAWDVLRMMKSSPGRFLIYGPGDERIWEFAYTDPFNAATFVETYALRGLGGQVLREYKLTGGNATGNWSLAEDFVYRDGQLLASATPTATTHFTLDHLGSPRLATGPTGTTVAYHAYYPFGEEATSSSQDSQRMKFTGHQRDNLGGGTTDDLDYMHARYGSPMTGRFLSVDPVGGEPTNPQSWNRYAYVHGNPVNKVDPDGQNPIIIGVLYIGFRLFFTPDAANAPTLDPDEEMIGPDGPEQFEAMLGAMGGGPRLSGGSTMSAKKSRDGQVNRRGGGKTGRKTNAARVESAKKELDRLRAELKEVEIRKNKTQADKQERERLLREIRKQEERLRASEEHARSGQGPR